MIRVLIVEDSPAVQRVLVSLLEDEGNIEIVGIAGTGIQALELCRKEKPDLVTMDIYMPEMDGLEATKRIMEELPTRIVIISSMVQSKVVKTFEAIHSGAVDIIEKPHGLLTGNYSQVKESLGHIIRQLMDAKPEKRFSNVTEGPWTDTTSSTDEPISGFPSVTPLNQPTKRKERDSGQLAIPRGFDPDIICIGGSTGAPAILCDILSSMPADFHVPIVAAQHIATGFMKGMVEWLDGTVELKVKLAVQGEIVAPGTATFAPDDSHLTINSKGRIRLLKSQPNDLYTPSIDIFYKSIAESFENRGLAIVLSGMGSDGTDGLIQMHAAGAATIAQDEKSSVVYGMPKEAFLAGAILEQMNPGEIITYLKKFYTRKKRKESAAR